MCRWVDEYEQYDSTMIWTYTQYRFLHWKRNTTVLNQKSMTWCIYLTKQKCFNMQLELENMYYHRYIPYKPTSRIWKYATPQAYITKTKHCNLQKKATRNRISTGIYSQNKERIWQNTPLIYIITLRKATRNSISVRIYNQRKSIYRNAPLV